MQTRFLLKHNVSVHTEDMGGYYLRFVHRSYLPVLCGFVAACIGVGWLVGHAFGAAIAGLASLTIGIVFGRGWWGVDIVRHRAEGDEHTLFELGE